MGQRCFNPQVENSLHSFKQVCLSLMLSSLELITTTEKSCSVQLVMWVSHSPGIVPPFFGIQLAVMTLSLQIQVQSQLWLRSNILLFTLK